MKKLFFFFCLLATAIAAKAQKQKTEAYIDSYKEIAIIEMMRSGVPAAITLAQGILESQSGESELVKNSNNHFGIKCKTEWTGEKTYHDDDAKGECFRVYPTAAESYKDHSDFLKTRPHYSFLFKLDPTDFEGWAKGLKKAGYATSPTYPQKLLKLINEYNLQQYSLQAMARMQQSIPVQQVTVTAAANETSVAAPSVAIHSETAASLAPGQGVTNAGEQNTTVVSTEKDAAAEPARAVPATKASYPQGVFTINHSKVIYATSGTSLLSLANQYDLPLSKLIEYNDLKEMDVLDIDRLMFLERKQKKGASDYHLVAEGETLHDICQAEGIRLENLLDYNDRLTKDATVARGDKIMLRSIAAAPANTKAVRSSARKSSRR